MSDKLKIGVVGCGLIAQAAHIPVFRRLGNKVIMQAVCDKNESLASEVARKYGVTKVYSDSSLMLSQEKLDVVDICTAPQTHLPLAIEAIGHGCHVLVEKPLALKTTDCDQLIQAAGKQGVKLCTIHNVLFHPLFLKARRLISEGRIGMFTGMRMLLSTPKDEFLMKRDHWVHKLPGGLIGETGPHVVYLSLALLNKVRNIDIFAKNVLEHPWAPFDEFRIEIEGEHAVSSVAVSYANDRWGLDIDILGTEGALHLDFMNLLLIREGSRRSMTPMTSIRSLSSTAFQTAKCVVENAFKLATRRMKYGHDIVIENFVNGLLNNQQLPVTAEEGRETVRVMEMIVARLKERYGV